MWCTYEVLLSWNDLACASLCLRQALAGKLHCVSAQGTLPALSLTSAPPPALTCLKAYPPGRRLTAESALTRCGPMVDLCHGPHLPNTGYLKSSAVGAVNRAFWRADVKREPLQVRSHLCRPSWSLRCPSAHFIAAQTCWEAACWPVLLASEQPAEPRHQGDVWQ